MKDPIGQAIHDHYFEKSDDVVIINSNLTEGEEIAPSYFFRSIDNMPQLEKIALEHCKGKILDVGAGAGAHSIILQNAGFDVTANEKSPLSCKVLKERGLKNIACQDIFDFVQTGYDTILLLMNGIGVAEDLEGLEKLFYKLKGFISPNGQILLDSSDIIYLFEEEDGSYWVDIASDKYYGEMIYITFYKNTVSEPFKWLFVGFEKLSETASRCGFKCKKVADGNHFDYLAKLTLQ